MYRRLLFLVPCVLMAGLMLTSVAEAELVGWWQFEEGSGTTALDSSGYDNHGQLFDNVQWADGKIGLAMQFDGASGHIEVPFSESLRLLNQGDFTICAWCLLNTVPPSTNRMVVQQGDGNGTGRTLLFIANTNEIRSYAGGATTGSGVGVVAGEWIHTAVIVTEMGATDSIQLYADGAAIGAANTTLGMENSEGAYFIGSHKNLNNVWDGLLDDVRIYNHALTEEELQAAMEGGGSGYPFARSPSPADGELHEDTWVILSWSPGDFAVSHNVYLGDNFEDVNNGTGDTLRGNQTATILTVGFPGFAYPDGLVPGTTYYGRIDEVNDAEPNSPWKGPVWSFSIPPKTAYDPNPADGAEFVDVDATLSWTGGFGAKLHTVYFGDNFDDVSNAAGGAPQGAATYKPASLELEKVYYWRVDEFDALATYKGDVWGFTAAGAAGSLQPANGATDVQINSTLNWTPATTAVSHDVYFGTDKDAVKNATTASPEFKGNKALGSESYDPGKLAWHSDHYWRVDAVYNTGTVKGLVWNFTTADFITVDDFESYNDIDPPDPNSSRIFDRWIDGFGTTNNGALVGNDLPPYAEQTIVHGSSQSLIYRYDNNLKTSEATLTLVSPRDWTEEGVAKLSLWFRGAPANSAERIYVALNGTAVVYHDDPAATNIGR
ncbi:MAG: LamG domain-containing protein, partial [Planctomycetota bacterium]